MAVTVRSARLLLLRGGRKSARAIIAIELRKSSASRAATRAATRLELAPRSSRSQRSSSFARGRA